MVSHLSEPPSAPLLKQLLLSGNSWPCILVRQIFSSTPSYSSTSVHVRPHWVVCRCIFCMDKYLLVTFDILRPWLQQVRSSEVHHSASSLTLGSKMGWLLNDRWYFSDELSDVQINIGSSLNIIIIILILCWSSTWIDHEETLCGFELNQSLEQAWYFRSDPSFFFYKKILFFISGNVKRKGSRH